MGNGASSTAKRGFRPASGRMNSSEAMKRKTLLPELRQTIRTKDMELESCAQKICELRKLLADREAAVCRLKGEVHKLKSVLQATLQNGETGGLSTIPEYSQIIAHERSKKQGVSGESSRLGLETIEHFEKNFRSKQLIKDAISNNDFMKTLVTTQVREVIASMYEKEIARGQYIIKEGEAGQHLYVSSEGKFVVLKDDKVIGRMGVGLAFGELAILYHCTRTASVQAVVDSKVWVLDRRVFQMIMMKTGLQRQEETICFLSSVPLLKNLTTPKLAKISDVLQMDFFNEGEYITREGFPGNTFFIINKGEVSVTQRIQTCSEPQEVRTLARGDYFGEKALISEDGRTANVIALAPGVECLTVDRESFIQLIGDLNELWLKDYGDKARGAASISPEESCTIAVSPISIGRDTHLLTEYEHVQLKDLHIITTLGIGGFGRVELVQLRSDLSKTFALKCLTKKHIVDTCQQEHIYSEMKILMQANSPFIASLYKTFKDNKYVYLMMEVCLGGELWTILRDRNHFNDTVTRFCVACVLEAFDYLHGKGIVYRDLKPENLILDSRGYIKLVDFGFAKYIGYGHKAWTFCGTPEYIAPEIILNRGHDHAADYWSLGVLIFELLTGSPPFTDTDPMMTYNIILKGIDVITFPKRIGRTPHTLIKRLCCDQPTERLGYGKNGITDIKRHKWFQGFDWEGLQNQTMVPPIVPSVTSTVDHSNFDKYPKDTETPPDEMSGWDRDF